MASKEENSMDMEQLEKLSKCNNVQQMQEMINEFTQNTPFLSNLNKEKFLEIMALAKESEELISEQNQLLMEKDTLRTKQVHLQKMTESVMNEIDSLKKENADLMEIKNNEMAKTLNVLNNFADSISAGVRKKFADSKYIYDPDLLERATKEYEERIINSEQEIRKLKVEYAAMLEEFKNLKGVVPENLESIAGKDELKKKVQEITSASQKLQRKRDELVTRLCKSKHL